MLSWLFQSPISSCIPEWAAWRVWEYQSTKFYRWCRMSGRMDSKGRVDLSQGTSLPGQRRRDGLPVSGEWNLDVPQERGQAEHHHAFLRIRGAEIVPECQSQWLPRSAFAETISRIGMHKKTEENQQKTELFTLNLAVKWIEATHRTVFGNIWLTMPESIHMEWNEAKTAKISI